MVGLYELEYEGEGHTAHYDTYSFFAMQLYGEKGWSLYDSTEKLPIREDREYEDSWSAIPPKLEITLHTGDVMYVPRGRYHSAITSTMPSLHMTVGIFSSNWIDVLNASVKEIQNFQQLRESVLNSFPSGGGYEKSLADVKAFVESRLDMSLGISSLQNKAFSRHVDARLGRLRDLLELSSKKDFQKFKRQGIPHKIFLRANKITLQFANKELQFPEFLMPLMSFICSKSSDFEISELPRLLDDKSLNLLLRKLVAEGFLTHG